MAESRLLHPDKSDLRRWRDYAEAYPDAHMADIVLALILEVERQAEEIRRLRAECT